MYFPEFPSAIWKPVFEVHRLAFRTTADFKGKLNQSPDARGAVIFPSPVLHSVGNQEDLRILDVVGRLSSNALTARQKEPRREDEIARA